MGAPIDTRRSPTEVNALATRESYEWFERTEAQTRLRDLFAADGVGAARGASPEGALLVARQGEGITFVLDGGAAMRSTLGMSDDGDLALTNRLERVRQLLEKERKRDLMLELPPRALDGAKAGTDAARARDEWKAATAERTRYEAMSGEIEALRHELEGLRLQAETLKTQWDEAQARQDALGGPRVARLAGLGVGAAGGHCNVPRSPWYSVKTSTLPSAGCRLPDRQAGQAAPNG